MLRPASTRVAQARHLPPKGHPLWHGASDCVDQWLPQGWSNRIALSRLVQTSLGFFRPFRSDKLIVHCLSRGGARRHFAQCVEYVVRANNPYVFGTGAAAAGPNGQVIEDAQNVHSFIYPLIEQYTPAGGLFTSSSLRGPQSCQC